MTLPEVAVFDLDMPPALEIIRSLGSRGVPVKVFGSRWQAGSFSRFVNGRAEAPAVDDVDEFVDWLTEQLRRESVRNVALTSDFVAFAAAAACQAIGDSPPGLPSIDGIFTSLFKPRFLRVAQEFGFPVPRTETPTDPAAALFAAQQLGYPLLVKPRSHVGNGKHRGLVIDDAAELQHSFSPAKVDSRRATELDADIGAPMLQQCLGDPRDGGRFDVVSVSGVLGVDGEPLAVAHSVKRSRWGPLGVGTIFEPAAQQPFTDQAVALVQHVLGQGIFELEVMVDRESGEFWAIDLNPRAFGHMGLDIASGHDLPELWYRSVAGGRVLPSINRGTPPEYWQQALPVWMGISRRLAGGPGRGRTLQRFVRHQRRPHIGAVARRADPLPGPVYALSFLRHPRSLLRTTTANDATFRSILGDR
jgi:predicted ATP-grasp superfamily ATP-dependent carboligase